MTQLARDQQMVITTLEGRLRNKFIKGDDVSNLFGIPSQKRNFLQSISDSTHANTKHFFRKFNYYWYPSSLVLSKDRHFYSFYCNKIQSTLND